MFKDGITHLLYLCNLDYITQDLKVNYANYFDIQENLHVRSEKKIKNENGNLEPFLF